MKRETLKAYKSANRESIQTLPISRVTRIVPNKKKVTKPFDWRNGE